MTDELKALQGTWTVVSLELDGQSVEGGLAARVVVKGDRFTTRGMGADYSGRVELDATATPRQFTLVFTDGPEKGNRNPGIYELDGNTWRICLNTRGGKRPEDFTTAPGSGLALETLRRGAGAEGEAAPARAKAGTEPSVAAPEGDPAPELAGTWKMASCVMDGRPLEAEFVSYGTREATATEVTVMMARQIMLKAAYRVDRSETPQRMNYTVARGPQSGKPQLGIYKLEGDRLETCFTAPGEQRPGNFGSVPGDKRTWTVWVKKGK